MTHGGFGPLELSTTCETYFSYKSTKTFTIMTHFCTYRSSSKEAWVRSKDYKSVRDLMAAMLSYVEKHPTLEVTYQYSV